MPATYLPSPDWSYAAPEQGKAIFKNGTDIYIVQVGGLVSAGGTGRDFNLLIWKSIDNGVTFTKIVDDPDRTDGYSANPVKVGTIICMMVPNGNNNPGRNLGMYQFDMNTDTFLADDFTGPDQGGGSNFRIAIPVNVLSDGTIVGLVNTTHLGLGAFPVCASVSWKAGIWGALNYWDSQPFQDMFPEWGVKQNTNDRIFWFVSSNNVGNPLDTGNGVFCVSMESDGTFNTYSQVTDGSNNGVPTSPIYGFGVDSGSPSILGDDSKIGISVVTYDATTLPPTPAAANPGWTAGIGPVDNKPKLQFFTATVAASPVFGSVDIDVSGFPSPTGGAFAISNITAPLGTNANDPGNPFASYWTSYSIAIGNCFYIGIGLGLWDYSDVSPDPPPAANFQGYLYLTSDCGTGFSVPTLLYTSQVDHEIGNVYVSDLGGGNLGIVGGELNVHDFIAQTSDYVSVFYLGVALPNIVVTCGDCTDIGEVGQPFSCQLTASGGTGPYTFAKTAGSVGPGLTLNADGSITGTPTDDGSFEFAFTATDSNGVVSSAHGCDIIIFAVEAVSGCCCCCQPVHFICAMA